jgi:hypothetical protein
MNDQRVLGVVLVVLGGLLIANPLYIYQHPDQVNEVRIVSEPREQPRANYTYAELSPRAKTLFDRARRSADNTTTFRGETARPEEFDFVDDSSAIRIAGNLYGIEYQGETHYVRAFQQPSLGEERRRSQGLLGLGVAIAIVGALYAWRANQSLTIGASLGAIGGLLLLLNLSNRYAPEVLGAFNVIGGSIFVMLAMLLGIASAGYLGYLAARELFLDRPPAAGGG